jgi:phosphate uptake regulator
MIVLQRKEMVAEAGCSPVGVPDELKATTKLAYVAELALRQDVYIVNKTTRKTNNKFSAENSVIAAFNLALLIAATAYREVAAEDPQVAKEMQEADPEARVLYDLITRAVE